MKDERKSASIHKKRGDTLDYYNDSLPKKAVESLFGKEDRSSPDAGSFISGYNLDDDYEPELEKEMNFDDDIDEYDEIPERTATQEKASYKEKSLHIPDSTESLEEHLALYSKAGIKKPKSDIFDTEDKPKRSNVVEMKRPRSEDGIKRVQTENDLKRRTEDDAKRRAEYGASTRSKSSVSRVFDDNDEDDEEYDSTLPVKNILIALAAVVVLIIFTALIIKINTINAAYAKAQTTIEDFSETEKALQQALIENESLAGKITVLEDVIEQYRSVLPQSLESSDAASGSENGDEAADANNGTTQANNSSTGQTTTYTVVSGDSLSKLSTRFYGTSSQYQKIMDANGLTDVNLQIGQILIIPN